MKANCWYGKQDLRVENVPIQRSSIGATSFSRCRRRRSADRIYISIMGSYRR